MVLSIPTSRPGDDAADAVDAEEDSDDFCCCCCWRPPALPSRRAMGEVAL